MDLLEFRASQQKLEKLTQQSKKATDSIRVAPMLNVGYTSHGITYGLFQRFSWDSRDVPFGGQAHFKLQGPVMGPGMYHSAKALKMVGGRFGSAAKERYRPQQGGDYQATHSAISETGFKFNRQKRILESEEIEQQETRKGAKLVKNLEEKRTKEKGRGGGFLNGKRFFQFANLNPGPGAYENSFCTTHGGETAPKYSM